MDREYIKRQLTKDNYIDFAFNRYQKFKQSNAYDEEYKFNTLTELNAYLQNTEIKTENIVEIVENIKDKNPSSGPFVHWNNTSDLHDYASEYPDAVAAGLSELFMNNEISIQERIETFRNTAKEINQDIRLGAPLFGYLLAAYNKQDYPIYKEGVFQHIKKIFGIKTKLRSISENYQDYYDLCSVTREYLTNKGFTVHMLDIQDFFYCLSETDIVRTESAVDFIFSISNELARFKEDTQLFINQISQLDRKTLEKKRKSYENEEKIKKIRYQILDYILNHQTIELEEIERIKMNVSKQYETNILHSWKDFTILFPLYYDSVAEKVDVCLSHIHKAIQNLDGLKGIELEKENVRKDFNWKQNFGDTNSWLAVYPDNHDTHKTAAQLYFGIFDSHISYGILYGTEHPKRGEKYLETVNHAEEFSYENMRKKFEEIIPRFIEENEENKEEVIPTIDEVVSGAEEPVVDVGYLWLTANPAIWSVEKIKDGGSVYYTAHNEKGNKRRMFSAFESAKPGDRVLFYESTPRKEIIAQGEVVEGLHPIDDDQYPDWVEGVSFRYIEDVEPISWEVVSEVEELKESAPIRNGAQGSLFKLTKEEFETILSLEPTQAEESEIPIPSISFEQDLNIESLYFTEKEILIRQVETALMNGKHIILTGPPGTGKSKLAKEICGSYKANYKMATATSDWSTYETIGGYKPNSDGTLSFQPGVFLDCFKDPKTHQPLNKWLIIDEINRADIDKAFGSLFSALTGDEVSLNFQSESGKAIVLEPQQKNRVTPNDYEYIIPDDWRLIGTMNTLDKASLYEMSYAFMRRFAFIPVGVPRNIDVSLIDIYLDIWNIADHAYTEDLAFIWENINYYRPIGPAIVEDIANYTATNGDFTSAIILYVLPQFEGIMDQDILEFVDRVSQLPIIEKNRLLQFCRDFFHVKV